MHSSVSLSLEAQSLQAFGEPLGLRCCSCGGVRLSCGSFGFSLQLGSLLLSIKRCLVPPAAMQTCSDMRKAYEAVPPMSSSVAAVADQCAAAVLRACFTACLFAWKAAVCHLQMSPTNLAWCARTHIDISASLLHDVACYRSSCWLDQTVLV